MMRKKLSMLTLLVAIAALGFPTMAWAEPFFAKLSGAEEVPSTASGGIGTFVWNFNPVTNSGDYTLIYAGLEGNATVAHIHIGQPGVVGGVSIFLCGNPPTTPACPLRAGTVIGTIDITKVIGPAPQLIMPAAANRLARVLRALRAGLGYVNVHSTLVPGGEIRGHIH